MKDVNFFIPYINKGKKKFNNRVFLIINLMIIILSLIGYGIFNELKIKNLSENMVKSQKNAEDSKTLEKAKSVSREKEELNSLELEIEDIKDLKESINKKNFINTKYIDSIIRRKPKDLFLTSISISSESVAITGTSNNRLGIAEFGKGLENIENCESIFISNISKEGMDYTFSLESKLIKEVEDGAIEEEEGTSKEQEYDENTYK